ncbi:MAG: hypothetical protein P8185_25465, partial [Deltaproteobacteria bacterium]
AVRARCVDCSGGFYSEVTDCEFSDCVLFPFRSGQGKQNAGARSKAIQKYCLWCMVGQKARCGIATCLVAQYGPIEKPRWKDRQKSNPYKKLVI